MTIGSPQVIHEGAFSQLHTATTIATHMTRPTMSRIVFFTVPPPYAIRFLDGAFP